MTTATETLFQPLTVATAPEASKPILEGIQKGYGFIPNLMATFANSPTVLQGYLAMDGAFEKGTFTPVERQLILLAASDENKCEYCVAAHSTIAKAFLKAPAETISAVRDGKPLADKKQNALVNLVREIVRERGYASPVEGRSLPRCRIRKAPGDGAAAWRCAQDGVELPRPPLPRNHRSGICGGSSVRASARADPRSKIHPEKNHGHPAFTDDAGTR